MDAAGRSLRNLVDESEARRRNWNIAAAAMVVGGLAWWGVSLKSKRKGKFIKIRLF